MEPNDTGEDLPPPFPVKRARKKLGDRYGAGASSSAEGSGRSTPLATDVPLTLPLPLAPSSGKESKDTIVSPLAALFTYPELVPCVLEQLSRPSHIATAMQVCKAWRFALRRKLYADVWVRSWEARPKSKLLELFATLVADPELCSFVKFLDVRFFPRDLRGEALYTVNEQILLTLTHMVNLDKLVWTRDGSISSELFASIIALPALCVLEISGHSADMYDARALGGHTTLEDLRVMIPDSAFLAALPDIVSELAARTRGGLRGLGLVCRSSNLVTNSLLVKLAPDLATLERLTLIGTPRLSKEGVYAVLKHARIRELVLDALPHSDLLDLSDAPVEHLTGISLSFPAPAAGVLVDPEHMPRIHAPRLRALELHLSGDRKHFLGIGEDYVLAPASLAALEAQVDFSQLSRLALLGVNMDTEQLRHVVAVAPQLEELYFSISNKEILAQVDWSALRNLKVFHANAPRVRAPERDELAPVAARLPAVQQIGTMNRVYEVARRWSDGGTVIELTRWGHMHSPAYFSVWRA